MNLKQIADAIRAAGHPVISVEAGTEGYDASISITPEIDVQVGGSYMVVNRWIDSEEAIKHCPQRTNVAKMPRCIHTTTRHGSRLMRTKRDRNRYVHS